MRWRMCRERHGERQYPRFIAKYVFLYCNGYDFGLQGSEIYFSLLIKCLTMKRYLCYTVRAMKILGCSQAVRHGTLTPAFVGPNPATPAKNLPGRSLGRFLPITSSLFILHLHAGGLAKLSNSEEVEAPASRKRRASFVLRINCNTTPEL